MRTALLVSLLGAGYLAWLLSDVGSPRAEVVVSELVFVAAPLYAAWSCWGAHRRDHATHTAWWWLTVGCLTWAVGSVTFATYQVVLGRVPPIPSLADVGYVGYAVPVALGIMRFPRWPGSLWSRWRSGLDSVVIAGCLLLTMSLLVLDPILDAAPSPPRPGWWRWPTRSSTGWSPRSCWPAAWCCPTPAGWSGSR